MSGQLVAVDWDDDDDPFDLESATREHYDDAALYDYEYRRRRADVNFYRALARELAGAGPILELGCGSGRLTAPLARDGHRVVGVDASAPMLARAQLRFRKLGRASRARAALVRGDMRRFALGPRFPLIVAAFNAFEHLYTRVDVAACLACVREHLSPGGRFAFDVQNPDLQWLTRDPHRRWARTRFRHPTTGERLEYTTNHVYDPISQIAFIRFYYTAIDDQGRAQGPTRVIRLSQRKFFPAELEALVYAGGLEIEDSYGGFAGEALVGACDSQVLVCRARAGYSETSRHGR